MTLHKININEEYRNKGFGSFFLQYIEDYTKCNHEVHTIRVITHQPLGCDSKRQFFLNSGYSEIDPDKIIQAYINENDKVYEINVLQKTI
jgi:N-acetylglutamate synthase-like GNAT family acetyltransferase